MLESHIVKNWRGCEEVKKKKWVILKFLFHIVPDYKNSNETEKAVEKEPSPL